MKSETIRDKTTPKQKKSDHRDEIARSARSLSPSKLIVSFARETHIVPIASIDYIESVKRKVFIHTDAGVHQMYSTMHEIVERLPDSFVRCHNSFLVNSDKVVTISSTELALGSGAHVPVSKRYAKEVRARLHELGV